MVMAPLSAKSGLPKAQPGMATLAVKLKLAIIAMAMARLSRWRKANEQLRKID
jgi:hypothetical protein